MARWKRRWRHRRRSDHALFDEHARIRMRGAWEAARKLVRKRMGMMTGQRRKMRKRTRMRQTATTRPRKGRPRSTTRLTSINQRNPERRKRPFQPNLLARPTKTPLPPRNPARNPNQPAAQPGQAPPPPRPPLLNPRSADPLAVPASRRSRLNRHRRSRG